MINNSLKCTLFDDIASRRKMKIMNKIVVIMLLLLYIIDVNVDTFEKMFNFNVDYMHKVL